MMNASIKQSARTLFSLIKQSDKIRAAHVSTSSPSVKVFPNWVMIDETVRITANGLVKGQKVTLQAYMEESAKSYGSCGHYIADNHGKIDTFQDSSRGGTFDGREPMGLFWSMKMPGTKPGHLIKADVMTPYRVLIALQDGIREFEDIQWSYSPSCLASCEMHRTYTALGVRKFRVKENGIYGTLFIPAGQGPFPAVIDLFHVAGGSVDHRRALLASNGIASFCLAYTGMEDLPQSYMDLDFNYFLKAFDWLASHPLIDSQALGGISSCTGGGYLSIIASIRPAMKCLVTINSTGAPVGKEQMVEGELIKPVTVRPEHLQLMDDTVSVRDMYLPCDDVTVCPSWRHGARHLIIQGLDDENVGAQVLKMLKSQIPSEFMANHTFLTYPGACHILDPPHSPVCNAGDSTILDKNLARGGDQKCHARAQEKSWPVILDFLHTNLEEDKFYYFNI